MEALLHDPSDAYITELSDLKTDRENAMKAIADSTPEHTERYYEFFTSPDFVCNRDLPTDEENYELE